MKKNPEVRKITSTVWCIDTYSTTVPTVVVRAAGGKIQFKIDTFESEDYKIEELKSEDLKNIVSDALMKAANSIKNLQT